MTREQRADLQKEQDFREKFIFVCGISPECTEARVAAAAKAAWKVAKRDVLAGEVSPSMAAQLTAAVWYDTRVLGEL
jgi:hypothetical protein